MGDSNLQILFSDDRTVRRDKEEKRREESRGDERIVQRSRSPLNRDRRDKDRDRYRESDARDKSEEHSRRGRREEPQVGKGTTFSVQSYLFLYQRVKLTCISSAENWNA